MGSGGRSLRLRLLIACGVIRWSGTPLQSACDRQHTRTGRWSTPYTVYVLGIPSGWRGYSVKDIRAGYVRTPHDTEDESLEWLAGQVADRFEHSNGPRSPVK
jgi:hypothetical protein